MTALPALPLGALWVAETFGPTVQGEGPSTGQQALFIRLAGCHLSCSWCDSAFTWDASRHDLAAERRPATIDELLVWVTERPGTLVVITGGEPLLQQQMLIPLVTALADNGYRIEIETSGTVGPRSQLTEAVTAFNVSPKLSSSGLPEHRRIRPDPLQALYCTGKAVWKFVVTDPAELDEIHRLERLINPTTGLVGPIWVMPEGTTPDVVLDRMRLLAQPVIGQGWNLSTRLHILLWGDTRGR
jgi:7-carboxy-7-deazaguanine synthase